MENCEELLQFWFGDVADEAAAARRQESLWWGGGAPTDALIRQRFGSLRESAIAGGLVQWEGGARGRLGLILLVDQFSRNIFRGQAEAYAHDGRAQQWCLDGLRRGDDRALGPLQRMFFYLPLEHAESRGLQARSVELMQLLVEAVPAQQRELFDRFAGYARHHRGVIDRFGRFPHRNAVLGRRSTPGELEFLRGEGA